MCLKNGFIKNLLTFYVVFTYYAFTKDEIIILRKKKQLIKIYSLQQKNLQQ